mmetsp:Transcript_74537/g.205447  ORF Transcript_74537/g.205447 Transcript_74537/m.205447 type:complete len:115 (-) Transcript_74537:140-484(-)
MTRDRKSLPRITQTMPHPQGSRPLPARARHHAAGMFQVRLHHHNENDQPCCGETMLYPSRLKLFYGFRRQHHQTSAMISCSTSAGSCHRRRGDGQKSSWSISTNYEVLHESPPR